MGRERIIKVGRNCWRQERAERVKFLVDASSYFKAFVAAVQRARRQIIIVGWDIHSQLNLTRAKDKPPLLLKNFLKSTLTRKRHLRIHILAWDYAMIYLFEREIFPALQFDWKSHRRLHFRLDGNHPLGASHHQKIVVIDDALAFVGGMDLTALRWDTRGHRSGDERRKDPGGNIYNPIHDVQMAVTGPVAAALGELTRERWHTATGKWLPSVEKGSDPWPPTLTPDIKGTLVAIARTLPAWKDRPEVREVETLYKDAIGAARQFIYIENQYLTSLAVGEAIAKRLFEEKGPEVVIINPLGTPGWLEDMTMGVLRARMLKKLIEADRYDRLRVLYPVSDGETPTPINVHAKVMVIDDRLVRIGSANLANRSMGLDTECDLAIEAGRDHKVSKAIAHFRNSLLAEHLGATIRDLEASFAKKGSLLQAIDSLRGQGRTLVDLEGAVEPWEEHFAPDQSLIDPERPLPMEMVIEKIAPEGADRTITKSLLKVIPVLVALAALAALWRWTALGDWLQASRIAQLVTPLEQTPWGPFAIVGIFTLASLLMVPVTALIIASALIFGPLQGAAYSLVGALISSILAYGLGRVLWRSAILRLSGSYFDIINRELKRQGILIVATFRIVPTAPFTILNLVAGSLHIRLRDYAIGTLLGMTPGILIFSFLSEQMATAIKEPTPLNISLTASIFIIFLATILWVRRWFKRRKRIICQEADERGDTRRC